MIPEHSSRYAMVKTLQCDSAISDLVLQAARAAIPAHVDQLITLPASSTKNEPLLPLLVALLDAARATAAAIGDNAWDDCRPLNTDLAADLSRQARQIADDLINATQCPDASSWSLPSCTRKELV
jgi:hypothetical protein